MALAKHRCIMHICGMRTHKQIVDAVGPEKLATIFGLPLSTTRSWSRRSSIPSEFWLGFRSRRWATYEELANAAATDRSRPQPSRLAQAVNA